MKISIQQLKMIDSRKCKLILWRIQKRLTSNKQLEIFCFFFRILVGFTDKAAIYRSNLRIITT